MLVPDLHGLVLVGGHSTRMQTDKAKLDYHGQPQYRYLYELLQKFCKQTFLSCRAEQAVDYQQFNVVIDAYPNTGPMGAVLSAFDQNSTVAWLVIACDMPMIDAEILSFLIANRNPENSATFFVNPQNNFAEPLLTIYEPAIYKNLKSCFEQNQQSLSKFLNNFYNGIFAQKNDCLFNANTPTDYQNFFQ